MNADEIRVMRLEDILPDLRKKRTSEQEISLLKIGMQEVKARLYALEHRNHAE